MKKNNDTKLKFLVPPNKPNRMLYKYISNTDRELKSIRNDTIFCSRMKNFNDIFDGAFLLNESNLDNIVNKGNNLIQDIIATLYIKKFDILARELTSKKDNFKKCKNLEEVFEKIEKTLEVDIDIKNMYIQNENERSDKDAGNLACRCFSENYDSLLMWSYYADSHKGFCVEYDLTTEKAKNNNIVTNIRKVNYTTSFPTNYKDGSAFFTKGLDWSHEQEWRLIVDNFNPVKTDGLDIEFPFVSAIYLGVNYPKNKIETIKHFAKEKNIKLFQMKSDNNGYALKVVEIDLG